MKLLFVCSGNICRSPMAEVLAEALGDRRGLAVEARSAGTLGLVDRTAHKHAIAVCREAGLDLRSHRSQPITDELIDWADHVLVMEMHHATHVREFFPSVGDKLLPLAPFAGLQGIDDPVQGWRFRFRRTRRVLETAIEGFLDRLAR